MAKDVMQCSMDKERGTDKKAAIMWKNVWKTHCVLVQKYNKLYSEKIPMTVLALQEGTIATSTQCIPCVLSPLSLSLESRLPK